MVATHLEFREKSGGIFELGKLMKNCQGQGKKAGGNEIVL